MHQGSCLCGTVRFEFSQIEGDFVYCHGKSCRKASGSAFGANIAVPLDDFHVVQGESELGRFESTPGKVRHFCRQCGSPLYNHAQGSDFVRVRLGAVDTEIQQTPKAHIFLNHKAQWDLPCDSISGYGEWHDPEEVRIAGTIKR